MTIQPNLIFDGRCEEAFRFYERCFGGRIEFLLRWKDSPVALQAPPSWGDKVLHATFSASGSTVCGADMQSGGEGRVQRVTLLVEVENPEEVDRICTALAEGGTVQMPAAETFWARRFCLVTDRFGVSWEIQCGR